MQEKEGNKRLQGALGLMATDFGVTRAIEDTLEAFLASYGYRRIDTPALEHTDLYLRKSGAELTSKMYTFTDQGGHRVSLRPEFTASVIRVFVEQGQSLPLPQRWQYSGPVFRYEPSHRSRYRQSTQLGAELIGSASPRADAEVVSLACRGLRKLGLERYQLVMGHVGANFRLLSGLGLSERVKSFLVGIMRELSRGRLDVEGARERLRERGLLGSESSLVGAIAGLDGGEHQAAVCEILMGISSDPTGSREAEEIVDRFLRKLKGADAPQQVEKALGFVAELSSVKGAVPFALQEAERLALKWGLSVESLRDIVGLVDILQEDELVGPKITIDFGLARGLAYYTGMVFEIRHDSLPGDLPLCGGGRYDGLVKALGGGKDVPALGFAYSVEHLVEALAAEGVAAGDAAVGAADVLVVPETSHAYGAALKVAERLRQEGRRVELEVRERMVKSSMEYARRRGISRVITVSAGAELTEHHLSKRSVGA